MIYSLSGKLNSVSEDFLVIDVQGVGYQVFVPQSVKSSLPLVREFLDLYIYHHIREDQQSLYGFLTIEERNFFVLLTSVSGVGPKVGVKILSHYSYTQLVPLILKGDIISLTQIPGVGKKMAERLILDLKDKIQKLGFSSSLDQSQLSVGHATIPIQQDLTMALKSLGYSQGEINRAIQKAGDQLSHGCALETGVKILLKFL